MNARYARQTALPQIGPQGQLRLAASSVLVIGAGGLGCPVLQYLAAAGVGHLRVVDADRVETGNLHRQPLYGMDDVGHFKVDAAATALRRLNPDIDIETHRDALTPSNAERLLDGTDIVIDAADSFAVTYTLSDICRAQDTPLISASVIGLGGYVGGFCGGAPSYRAVFPEPPASAARCTEAGVLGSVVAVIGSLQAQFALQLLLGLAPSPLGRLLSFEAGRLGFGGFDFHDAAEPAQVLAPFVAAEAIGGNDLVVDLRSLDEAPTSPFAGARRLTVDDIERLLDDGAPPGRVVLCCRSGLRAWRAAQRLSARGIERLALVALGAREPGP